MNQPMRKIEVDEATAKALEKRAAEIGTSVGCCGFGAGWLETEPTDDISDEELAALDRQWAQIQGGTRADRAA